MDSLRQMELMVSLPLDAEDEDEDDEVTPRQQQQQQPSSRSSGRTQKPPIPPKASTSPKQPDKPPKHTKRPDKLHMPDGHGRSEKSPRFVCKKDSWKETGRPVLPPAGENTQQQVRTASIITLGLSKQLLFLLTQQFKDF